MTTPANQLVIYVSDAVENLQRMMLQDHDVGEVIAHLHPVEVIEALERMEETEGEVVALRLMRDENAQQITALEAEIERLRSELHNAFDMLENRSR